jgi:TldD protein
LENGSSQLDLDGLTPAGKGWELVLDADIPGQLRNAIDRIKKQRSARANPKPAQLGRYPLVCDGFTMASLLECTLGVALQLDRAMGYEANASGTSFLNDPLEMLGTFQVASPRVTMTANRSILGQLATVKWDAEGVVPDDFTLVENGIVVDFQTTREQAAWIAPYYQRHGLPSRSHGCASADSGLDTPLQALPNLTLEPGASNVGLDALIGGVRDGIFLTKGTAKSDFQARTGIVQGMMREIKNGRLGRPLMGGAIMYDTIDLWKNVTALGGASTQAVVASSGFPALPEFYRLTGLYPVKGEPPQRNSASISAVAAMIDNQPLVNLRRKA